MQNYDIPAFLITKTLRIWGSVEVFTQTETGCGSEQKDGPMEIIIDDTGHSWEAKEGLIWELGAREATYKDPRTKYRLAEVWPEGVVCEFVLYENGCRQKEIRPFGWYDEQGNIVEENPGWGTRGYDPFKKVPPDLRKYWGNRHKKK